MEANTGINMAGQQPAIAVQQPPTQLSTAFTTHQPLKNGVKITAILHIVFGGLCVAMGMWGGIEILEFSLLYFCVLLYIPAGLVGLRAASNHNKCTEMIYQTMSIFCCFAAASQSLSSIILCIKLAQLNKLYGDAIGLYAISIAQPVLALLFNIGEAVVAAIAIFIVHSSNGWCCDSLAAQSNLVPDMKSSPVNPVSSISPAQHVFAPPKQAFTVQHGMNINQPDGQYVTGMNTDQPDGQPAPSGMSLTSY